MSRDHLASDEDRGVEAWNGLAPVDGIDTGALVAMGRDDRGIHLVGLASNTVDDESPGRRR